jgi:polyphosphate kinase
MSSENRFTYKNKELSWLGFNARVLQEAADPSVPLADRLKFMGIYSSNLDEFFRVRVATLKRLSKLGKKSIQLIDDDPTEILDKIRVEVLRQQQWFHQVHDELLAELEEHNIFILREDQLDEEQREYVREYFQSRVRSNIFPVIVHRTRRLPELHDRAIYLFVEMKKANKRHTTKYSLIEVPVKVLGRFVLLPPRDGKQYVITLEDVIRFGLPYIFHVFNFTEYQSYAVKVTRDAELDIEDDFSVSYLQKIHNSIERRKQGNPVRFVYDKSMPQEMVDFLKSKLYLKSVDTVVAGSRYQNHKDFTAFPDIIDEQASLAPARVRQKDLPEGKSVISRLEKRDILLHMPYHSFDYFLDLLREASIDPKVEEIKMTLYRLARRSSVINALINARKNGKAVTVFLELEARFDEKANIRWANTLKDEGVRVIFGIQGLKVHAKICLIAKRKRKGLRRYAVIGTGNFNEDTARLYTDACLMTAEEGITAEIAKVFEFLEANYKVEQFDHLILAPFYNRKRMIHAIEREIANARKGLPASIKLKLNNISDKSLSAKLYEAAEEGVRVQIICRSMCSLVPEENGLQENLQVISIVDKYLEHARLMVFANGGEPQVYITSSDMLPRNLDRRVEVTCPIYREEHKRELEDLFDLEWRDNTKARVIDAEDSNQVKQWPEGDLHRAQDEKFHYLVSRHGRAVDEGAMSGLPHVRPPALP